VDNPRLLAWYYAATALFVVLDVSLDLNIRAAFLEPWPTARLAYYGFCFACLAAVVWRPQWSAWIGTGESLVVLVALIMSMALRVMVPNDAIFDENARFVTFEEIINFLLAGFVAYFAWINGMKRLTGKKNW
jgi:hypothetical protein